MTRDEKKTSALFDRRKIGRLGKADAVLGWLPILGLPILILWQLNMLDDVWLNVALWPCVLCPLAQWYCREKADRIERSHNRRRKERDDGLKAAADSDLTDLLG